MLPPYINREAVKRALDIKVTARADAQVDRAIQSASRDVDSDLNTHFFPLVATYTFKAPRASQVVFFDDAVPAALVTLDTLTVDGTAVDPADRDLLPVHGPPFTRVEFGKNTVFFGTDRRPVEAGGTWGYDDRTEPAGELAAALGDTTGTTVDVSDGGAIGVGDLVTVGSERMLVTDRRMLDTGQDLAAGLTDSSADVGVQVPDGSAYQVDEVLLVDSERMLVVDVAGNTLVVKRAWDGSVLASHSLGADVFASRRLTVERGAVGSTAATHSQGAGVVRQVYPGPVVAYSVAIAEHQYLKELTGQGGEVGGRGVKTSLEMVAERARKGYRRLLLA